MQPFLIGRAPQGVEPQVALAVVVSALRRIVATGVAARFRCSASETSTI